MNKIRCSIGDCPSVFETEEAVSPKIQYICRLHPKKEQDTYFQENQFDKDMKRGSKPMGTQHIKNQASEILTSEDIPSDDQL